MLAHIFRSSLPTLFLLAVLHASAAAQQSLEFSRWSGDINVPDPVAISFDDKGRAYVTQTQRRKANDLDIRANRDWVTNDVSLQSVDQKRDFYHERLAPGGDNDKRVQDLNEDGSNDYKDLMFISELIHRLEDTDGDGVADKTQLFADGFNSEVTGIAAGVLYHEGHVYATIAPDVWKLTDTNDDGTADRREIMATGFGLHIAYAGHDMHGLTVGPDGKIYWSIGDKGISATSKEGRKFHFPNQGGVMRCNPDGTDFEVFAHGLRNVQELAFDQFGNVFGVDNDSDQPKERERFVYIVKGMDAGWRCNYQYRGEGYNPWMDEGLWELCHDGQPAYIVPPISHSINGPAGFTYNPGTALGPEYYDYFFLAGAPGGPQIAFQTKPNGASFEMVNEHEIGRNLPIVGINFGPDGALYGVDWGGGYPLNQTGAIWKIDDPAHAGSAIRKAVQQLLADGMAEKSLDQLRELLSHADQRIRLKAQFELVARGQFKLLIEAASNATAPQLSRLHAIWGLGQICDKPLTLDTPAAAECLQTLVTLLTDADVEIQFQAARTLADIPSCDGDVFLSLLDTANDRLRFQAMMSLGDHGSSAAFEKLTSIASRLTPAEGYLRHAVSMALASCGTASQLEQLHNHASSMARLCAVVALRHQQAEQVAAFLSDSNVAVAEEAARAIHDDFSIEPAMLSLANSVAEHNSATENSEAFLWRSINANYRIGGLHEFRTVLAFADDSTAPMAMRLEAMDALVTWNSPVPLDRVTGRFRTYGQRFDDFKGEQTRETLAGLLRDSTAAMQAAAMKLHQAHGLLVNESMLLRMALGADSPSKLVMESLNLLDAQTSSLLPQALQHTIGSADGDVRMRSLELMVDLQIPAAFAEMQSMWPKASSPLRQKIVRLMNDLATPEADRFLVEITPTSIDEISNSKVSIEILEMLKQRSSGNAVFAKLRSELDRILAQAAAESVEQGFAMCLTGGNKKLGKAIFNTHLEAQCVRCHRVGDEGSTVGPNLADIATKRKPEHLLRAVVAPSADIEPNYRSVVVVLASGKTVPGIKLKETEEELVIADSQGKEIAFAMDDVDDVFEQNVSIMPDMTRTLSLSEIRDVVTYLLSLKQQ